MKLIRLSTNSMLGTCGLWLLLLTVGSTDVLPVCRTPSQGVPIVRNLSAASQDNYARPGLSHITIAGHVHHGLNEVEVWLQTFAPGGGTPIHRHDCEEVFIVIRGEGSYYSATAPSEAGDGIPGRPTVHRIYTNTTFTVPRKETHQIRNTGVEDDLQLLVFISKPPIKVFVYPGWFEEHRKAVLKYPYPWDATCTS